MLPAAHLRACVLGAWRHPAAPAAGPARVGVRWSSAAAGVAPADQAARSACELLDRAGVGNQALMRALHAAVMALPQAGAMSAGALARLLACAVRAEEALGAQQGRSSEGPAARSITFRESAYAVVLARRAEFAPRDLATVLRAYAAYEECDSWGLFDACAKELPEALRGYSIGDAVHVALAIAESNLTPAGVRDAVFEELAARCGELAPAGLRDAGELLGMWEDTTGVVWGALRSEAAARLEEFTPSDLADFVGTHVCSAGPVPPGLRQAVAATTTPRIAEFAPEDVANLVQCVGSSIFADGATVSEEERRFFEGAAGHALGHLDEFTNHDLHNLLVGSAHARVVLADFVPAVWAALERTTGNFSQYTADDLADVVCGATILNSAARRGGGGASDAGTVLSASVNREILVRLPQFQPDDLLKIVYAYAHSSHAPAQLFDAIAMETSSRIAMFTPEQLSAMAGSYHAVGMEVPAHWTDAQRGGGGGMYE